MLELPDITIWRGRKEIAGGTGKTYQTIKKWYKQLSFPLRYDPGGQPFLVSNEYLVWLLTYDDLKQGKKLPVNRVKKK